MEHILSIHVEKRIEDLPTDTVPFMRELAEGIEGVKDNEGRIELSIIAQHRQSAELAVSVMTCESNPNFSVVRLAADADMARNVMEMFVEQMSDFKFSDFSLDRLTAELAALYGYEADFEEIGKAVDDFYNPLCYYQGLASSLKFTADALSKEASIELAVTLEVLIESDPSMNDELTKRGLAHLIPDKPEIKFLPHLTLTVNAVPRN